jgi:hypothetical protein
MRPLDVRGLALSLLLHACADGAAEGPPTTDPSGTDTPADSDAASDTDAPTCDPVACPAAPDPTCADATTVAVSAPACDATGACVYPTTAVPCAPFQGCELGACGPAPLCEVDIDATAAVGTLTQLRLGGAPPADDACCEDRNADGAMDNRLGAIMSSLGGLGGVDLNALIADQLATGALAWTLAITRPDPADPEVVQIDLLPSRLDGVADPAVVPLGTATYLANLDGFADPARYLPRSQWTGRLGPDGALDARGTVELPLPLFGLPLSVRIDDAHLTGTLRPDATPGAEVLGGAFFGAQLSGVLARASLFEAENDAFASRCACASVLTPSGALVDADGRCGAVDLSACAGAPEAQFCADMANFGTITNSLFTADLDTDADGAPDALSTGWWLTATTAAITGVEGCAP